MSMKGEDPGCLKKLGNNQYASQLSNGLNQLRKETSFCDVTIVVGEQRFPAHKAVLSCASSYFQGMFSSGFKESSMTEVKVPGTEKCFAQLLEFAYTGYFQLSLRTAVGILEMACYMGIQGAMKLCTEYLVDVKPQMSMDDCFEVWSIATNHAILKDLTESFHDHLVGNFSECGRSSMFLENASADVLLQMLMDDGIETYTCGEEKIIAVVLAWLKYDWENRQIHAVDLLKKLRLGLLPLDKLQELFGEELLSIPECKAMVDEVRRLAATKEDTDVPLMLSHPDMFASRNTITGELYQCCLGFICQTTSGCYRIDRLNNHPSKFPYMEKLQCGYTVVDGSELYVASGFGLYDSDYQQDKNHYNIGLLHQEWLKKYNFCKFDLITNRWTVLQPMKHQRGYDLSLHIIGDLIYAVGRGNSGLDYIQRYSLITNDWIGPILLNGHNRNAILDHAVVEDKILFVSDDDDDDEIDYLYLLYDPVSNSVCDVKNNSPHISMHEMRAEVDADGTCYFRKEGNGGDDDFYKAICDFSTDKPSITLEYQEGMYTSCNRNRKDSQWPVLALNKKILKMAKIAEEHNCHRQFWVPG